MEHVIWGIAVWCNCGGGVTSAMMGMVVVNVINKNNSEVFQHFHVHCSISLLLCHSEGGTWGVYAWRLLVEWLGLSIENWEQKRSKVMQRVMLIFNSTQLELLQHGVQYNIANYMPHNDVHVVHMGQIVCGCCELISDAKIMMMLFQNVVFCKYLNTIGYIFSLTWMVHMCCCIIKLTRHLCGRRGLFRAERNSQHYFLSHLLIVSMLSLCTTR